MRRPATAALCALGLLFASRSALADRQPPDYGDLRKKSLAPDLAAAGAVVGGIVVPMLIAVPPWSEYSRHEQDSIIDSDVGAGVATDYILRAELYSIGLGTGLAMTGWLAGGGYKSHRIHWAIVGGLVGSGVGAGVGLGAGLLVHRPLSGRVINTSGEREWVLGYSVGVFTLTTFTAVGTTAGVLLGGGKIEGKKTDEVQLALRMQGDVNGALVPTPSITGRW
jgi:hypothetical protein